mgnify:CR=1 FL=1
MALGEYEAPPFTVEESSVKLLCDLLGFLLRISLRLTAHDIKESELIGLVEDRTPCFDFAPGHAFPIEPSIFSGAALSMTEFCNTFPMSHSI